MCLASLGIAQNIVVNPGFENGSLPPWVASSYGGGAGGGAWSVGTGAGSAHSGTYFATNGCNNQGATSCITPDPGNHGAYLYQDLTTVPGAQYTLTFYYAPGLNAGPPPPYAELQVLWGPSASALTSGGRGTCTGNCVSDNVTNLSTGASRSYTQYTVSLTATSASMRLEFLGEQDPAQNFLDDISVSLPSAAVPALAKPVLLLLVIGLALLGAALLPRHAAN